MANLSLVFKAVDEASASIKKIEGSLAGISKQVTATDTSLKKHSVSVLDMAKAIGVYNIAAAALSGAASMAGGAIVGFNSKLEQAGIAFEVMTGSATTAQTHLEDLRQFAQSTPFEFPELLDASKKLQAFGIATSDVVPLMTTLGNITAGVGTEKLPQLILAFGQVSAATRLTGNELRQFTEAGVPLLGELAKHYGKTAAEVQKMVTDGKVGADAVRAALDAMSAAGGRFENLMARQSRTFDGAISNIKDGLNFAISEGFKPLFRSMSEAAVAAADFLQSADFKSWAADAARFIAAVTGALGLVKDTVIALVTGRGFDRLYEALNATFGHQTARWIADVVEQLRKMGDVVGPVLAEAFDRLQRVAYDVWEGIKDAVQFVKDNAAAQWALEAALTAVIAKIVIMKTLGFAIFLQSLVTGSIAAAGAIAGLGTASAAGGSALGALGIAAGAISVPFWAAVGAVAAVVAVGWKLSDAMNEVKPGIEGTELAAIAASDGLGAMNRAVEENTASLGLATGEIAVYNEWLAAMASQALYTRYNISLLNEGLTDLMRQTEPFGAAMTPYGPGINEGWKNPLEHAVKKPPPGGGGGGGGTKEATADIIKWNEATGEAIMKGVGAARAVDEWNKANARLVEAGDFEAFAAGYQALGKDLKEATEDWLKYEKDFNQRREEIAKEAEEKQKARAQSLGAALTSALGAGKGSVMENIQSGLADFAKAEWIQSLATKVDEVSRQINDSLAAGLDPSEIIAGAQDLFAAYRDALDQTAKKLGELAQKAMEIGERIGAEGVKAAENQLARFADFRQRLQAEQEGISKTWLDNLRHESVESVRIATEAMQALVAEGRRAAQQVEAEEQAAQNSAAANSAANKARMAGGEAWAVVQRQAQAAFGANYSWSELRDVVLPWFKESGGHLSELPEELAAWASLHFGSFASGGVVPGVGPQLAVVHGGETIIPAGKGGSVTVNVYVSGSIQSESDLKQTILEAITDSRRRGGLALA